MSFASAHRQPGKRSGKQNGPYFGVRGSPVTQSEPSRRGAAAPLRPVALAENRGFGTPPMPKAAESLPLFAFCCFPPASPAFAWGAGKQKRPRRTAFNRFIFLEQLREGRQMRILPSSLALARERTWRASVSR